MLTVFVRPAGGSAAVRKRKPGTAVTVPARVKERESVTAIESTPVESWRPVVGWEGLYEVSDFGRVRSLPRKLPRYWMKGRVLRPGRSGNYPAVHLADGPRREMRHVHTLVATAFIGPRPEGHEVNHKDRDRLNPRADNLEYTTHAENIRHTIATGRAPMPRGFRRGKLTAAQVAEIRASVETLRALARRFDVSPTTIGDVRRRRIWRDI